MSVNFEPSPQFQHILDEALSLDLSDLKRSGCVKILPRRSADDVSVVMVMPRLGFLKDSSDQVIKRMMLLLFLEMDAIADGPYVMIYAHTPMSILSQQTVIYRYYTKLPFSYRKNMKMLYILRPQYAVKAFFEFAKVFLSEKFYRKLVLVGSLVSFERLVPSSVLSLPTELHALEDRDCSLLPQSPISTIAESFVPQLGTTYILHQCITFLRKSGALTRKGIFRIAGDDALLTMAKTRLQTKYCWRASSVQILALLIAAGASGGSGGRPYTPISVPKFIKIGEAILARDTELKNVLFSNSGKGLDSGSSLGSESNESNEEAISTVYFNDIDTVGQIIKFIIREVPEPIVTLQAYQHIEALVKARKQAMAGAEPSDGTDMTLMRDIIAALKAELPISHMETFNFILRYALNIIAILLFRCKSVS